jgi:hypothetical protein
MGMSLLAQREIEVCPTQTPDIIPECIKVEGEWDSLFINGNSILLGSLVLKNRSDSQCFFANSIPSYFSVDFFRDTLFLREYAYFLNMQTNEYDLFEEFRVVKFFGPGLCSSSDFYHLKIDEFQFSAGEYIADSTLKLFKNDASLLRAFHSTRFFDLLFYSALQKQGEYERYFFMVPRYLKKKRFANDVGGEAISHYFLLRRILEGLRK